MTPETKAKIEATANEYVYYSEKFGELVVSDIRAEYITIFNYNDLSNYDFDAIYIGEL